jgi:hypothetical protein
MTNKNRTLATLSRLQPSGFYVSAFSKKELRMRTLAFVPAKQGYFFMQTPQSGGVHKLVYSPYEGEREGKSSEINSELPLKQVQGKL